jgi:hypothetical protein
MAQMLLQGTSGRFVIVGIRPGEKRATFVLHEGLQKELGAMQY